MTICKKCKKELEEEWISCPFCGTKTGKIQRKKYSRSNGQGSAYQRGKTWTARITIGWDVEGNKPIQRCRTKGGFPTKSAALAYIPELLKTPGSADKSITLKELYDEWFPKYSNEVSRSTMLCYQSAWKYYSNLYYTKFSLITPSELQKCIDDCPRGKRTKENMKALSSLLYKYAMHYELVDRNKAETLRTGHDETFKWPALEIDELEKIKQSDELYAPYVVALCYLGCRPNELWKTRKQDLDMEKRFIKTGSKTEAGKDRIITFSPKILPIMEKQLETPGEYLFPRLPAGEQMQNNHFDRVFKAMMKRIGIENRVPYSCRHTFSNLLKNIKGADVDKAALMGHSDYSMTKYYQEADYESLRAITDLM